MMFCTHLTETGCTHLRYLDKKLCSMSGSGAFQFCTLFKTLDILEIVMLVTSISEMLNTCCFSSLNNVSSKLLLFIDLR